MATKLAAFTRGALAFSCLFVAVFLLSCSFQHGSLSVCAIYQGIPVTPLTAQTSHTVFETPGTIIAIHGSGSATHQAGNSADAIKVQQSLPIPAYADQALVFLNGWKLDYVGGDQHVLALGSAITEIHVDPKLHTVAWDALGLIRDDDGAEGYNLTYQFTIVAWNGVNLNAFVDQGAINSQTLDCTQTGGQLPDNYFYASNSGTSSALSCFFSFLQNNSFASSKSIAILPRGFGLVWNDGDHHIFQLAYNMDHSEILADNRKYNKKGQQIAAPLPNPPSTHVGSGFVSWSPYAIFEDNDTRRDYTFAEIVSGLGGSDVGLLQPPFSILPNAADTGFLGLFSSCGEVGAQPTTTEEHTIENIPYQFAVPMLTGWNMQYVCSDQHVKDVGIWIDDWSYQPPSGGNGGVLHYKLSSILADDDSTRAHAVDHRITVLGLRGVTGGNVKGVKPVPPKPAGNRE
jgi:hypothetical protein